MPCSVSIEKSRGEFAAVIFTLDGTGFAVGLFGIRPVINEISVRCVIFYGIYALLV